MRSPENRRLNTPAGDSPSRSVASSPVSSMSTLSFTPLKFVVDSPKSPSSPGVSSSRLSWVNGNALFETPHLYSEFSPGLSRAGMCANDRNLNVLGYIMKRRGISGLFSRRFVEVSGGFISWTKPDDVSTNVRVSCRRLAGAVVRAAADDAKIEKMSSGLHVFVIYFAYDAREFKVHPLILGSDSLQEMQQWVGAIVKGSGWRYQPACLAPLPRRLCGLIVIEVISIENVVPGDWNGKSDPYVLVSYNGLMGRTAPQYKTLSCHFNEYITLPVYNDDPNSTIQFLVMDQDHFSTDDILALITLPLHSLGFNKEVVWDSLALRPTRGSILTHSNAASDRYGTISFRTFYKSSKLTQFLPLKQTPAVCLVDHPATVAPINGDDEAGEKYSAVLQKSLTAARLDRRLSRVVGGDETGSEKSVSPEGSPKLSPKEGKPLGKDEEEEDAAYDFSIEMFKSQIVRILAIIKMFSVFKSVGYIVSWRDPRWTVMLYLWLTWVCLVEPQSALMFFVIYLCKLLLQAHPCYTDFVEELSHTSIWDLLLPANHHIDKNNRNSASTVSIGGSGGVREFRVFECQRRKMAGAMTMISTMVKMPAQVAIAAGSAAAHAVISSKEDHPKPSSPKVSKEIEDLFVNFSGTNLKQTSEAEWVSPSGVALGESPATVIDGMKIKWSVAVVRKKTDKNGWEYSRAFPVLSPEVEDFLVDPKKEGAATWWGSSHRFEPKLKLHRHWVRRRLWIGTAVRPALKSEEPILLSQVALAAAQGEIVETNQRRSLLARFKQLMEEGKKLQNILFGLATKLESLKNLVSWKARWISSLIFWVLIFILVCLLFVSQFAVVWAITSFILLDSLVDVWKLQGLTEPLIAEIHRQLKDSDHIHDQWKRIVEEKLTSYFSNLEEILSEVPVSIVCSLCQKACDSIWFENAVVLSLDDFDTTSTNRGGPLTLGMVLERIYLAAHSGDADWWKSVKTGVHPKNLMKGHLVSDWEQFNPSSIFAPQT